MCNEYQLRVHRADYDAAFRGRGVDSLWLDPEPNRPPERSFRPTDRAPLLRLGASGGLEGLEARWWLTPAFHRGPVSAWKAMCTNARIETVSTAPAFRDASRSGRCLVPATAFFEYDQPPGWRKGQAKRRWEITWPETSPAGPLRVFAGVSARAYPADHPDGLDSFAIITRPAGPALAALHDRQPAVVSLEAGLAWLRDGDLAALQAASSGADLRLAEAPARPRGSRL